MCEKLRQLCATCDHLELHHAYLDIFWNTWCLQTHDGFSKSAQVLHSTMWWYRWTIVCFSTFPMILFNFFYCCWSHGFICMHRLKRTCVGRRAHILSIHTETAGGLSSRCLRMHLYVYVHIHYVYKYVYCVCLGSDSSIGLHHRRCERDGSRKRRFIQWNEFCSLHRSDSVHK